MAHIEKYNASALGGMCGHYERAAERKGFERENIDNTKTYLNYNLAPEHDMEQVDFINARIASLELKKAVRKDAIKMCDCVVTMPKNLDSKYREKFFESVYSFLADRYGEENVVSAYVHLDEAQPHIHFAWVPVTPDGRLSAKSVVTRNSLQSLHSKMQAYVEKDLGVPVSILLKDEERGDKQLSHLNQAEYKAAKTRLAGIQNEVSEQEQRLEFLRREVAEIEAQPAPESLKESLQNILDNRGVAREEAELRADIEELERRCASARDRAECLRGLMPGLRSRVSSLTATLTRTFEHIGFVPSYVSERVQKFFSDHFRVEKIPDPSKRTTLDEMEDIVRGGSGALHAGSRQQQRQRDDYWIR